MMDRTDGIQATRAQVFADMMGEVRELNEAKGWRTGTNTFGDYVALLHSEVSEMLEAYRDHKLEAAVIAYPEGVKPIGVPSEAADVLIRLLDMCDLYGIDLARAYHEKMAYGWVRPFRHGGRTL